MDLPVGGGVSMNDASLRAFFFATDPATGKERLIGGQRVPFLVHFAKTSVQGYAQMLWGINDDPTSAHYADQAHLASEKILRPVPQSLAALRRDSATETVLTIGGIGRDH